MKTFQRRKRRSGQGSDLEENESNQIGRIPVIVPGRPDRDELFYLRLLLYHVPGPTGFDFLKRVEVQERAPDGSVKTTTKICQTFHQACVLRGLCEGDQDSREALKEAMTIKFGKSLRLLFVTIVANGMVADARSLFDEFQDELSEDGKVKSIDAKATPYMINKALIEMKQMFLDFGVDMVKDKNMPEPHMDDDQDFLPRELQQEIDRREGLENKDPNQSIAKMNSGQRQILDQIIISVKEKQGRLFAIDAPGGTGKTFLLCTLLDKLRKDGHIAVATAYTGIAAILLPGGRTLHSRMKIPIDGLTEETILPITGHKNATRKLFEETDLLIIDEVTMTERKMFLAIDRTLQEIRENKRLFGGLTIVVSGDWRQTLPVIPKANRAQIVDETLKGTWDINTNIICQC